LIRHDARTRFDALLAWVGAPVAGQGLTLSAWFTMTATTWWLSIPVSREKLVFLRSPTRIEAIRFGPERVGICTAEARFAAIEFSNPDTHALNGEIVDEELEA
jgi:hypothetical protein